MAQPNIVLIVCDQLRGDCLGAAGHPDVKTPYLDTLAAEGTLFEHAYSACPSCIPARAGLLTGLGTLHCSDVVGIPALAHFHGDRPFCICHNLLHDAPAAVWVQHQLTACAAGHDLGGRAAHIDIHKVELVLFDGGGGFAHDLGHFAKDLHAIGCTVGFGLEQAHRLVVAVHQRPAGHHFAHSKACTVLGHQAAAGCIRKARHRAEHRPVRQDDIADFKRLLPMEEPF